MNTLKIDFSDFSQLLSLMERHEEFPYMIVAKTRENEDMWISINKDRITARTFQKNDYERINTYYKDGTTTETFSKGWMI